MFMFWKLKVYSAPINVGRRPAMMLKLELGAIFA